MSLEEIIEYRIKKLNRLKEIQGEIFPISINRDFSLAEVKKSFSKFSKNKKEVSLAGRIFAIRHHGGAIFCDFKDGSWENETSKPVSLQAFLKKDVVGEEKFSAFKNLIDIGDFVEFRGVLFLTKKKEQTIKVFQWRIIAKGLRPLPEKWHKLSDIEERFRKRYLDLLMNDEVYTRFLLRSKIITELRNFLNLNGFIELETPILQTIASGALAQPFKTHHNALNIDLFLRIAPELYLKKLLIGGFEKIYEIGRCFRNEGIDATHNPEFTMLEFYWAYKDAQFIRNFVEEMLKYLTRRILKKKTIEFNGNKISFNKKFSVISFSDVLKRYALISDPNKASIKEYRLKAKQFGIEFEDHDSRGKIADYIFKKICRPKLIQPVFVVDYPIEISPLAKQTKNDPKLTDRFQLVIGGLELVNAFSELNDPLEQARRFKMQAKLRANGDKEALEFDQSFLEAMEYGMPPAAGVGIGLDRLVMFFLNIHNIKEVILFPTLKPKGV